MYAKCSFWYIISIVTNVHVWFLDVIEPLLAMMLFCQDNVALMLLCIGSSIGTVWKLEPMVLLHLMSCQMNKLSGSWSLSDELSGAWSLSELSEIKAKEDVR